MTRVGLVTFDFPPQYRRADLAGRPTALGSALAAALIAGDAAADGVEVVVPSAELAAVDPGASGGIRSGKDLAYCVDLLRARRVQCIVIEVFHWARLALVSQLVNEMDLPVAVYAVTGDGWNGVPCATAICGSLREAPRNINSSLVDAFLGSDVEGLLRWIAGTSALVRMRSSRVMLWGGGYGAEMPYSRGDPASIEAVLLGEVMTEQEEVLIRRANAIIEGEGRRIEAFFSWIQAHGATIERDEEMITRASLDFQAALYLAARDRLDELEREGPADSPAIAGATIKCHYEMSIGCQGCTACFLPAFLPFGSDSEGKRNIVPLACEGDLGGIVSLVMLHQLNPEVPPLFGDLVSYRPDHVLLRNCGASSLWWAGLSADPSRSLSRTRLRPNIHGASGAALHYETPAVDSVTFARLFRQDGSLAMLVGEGRILEEVSESRYSDPWPHTRLDLGIDTGLLFKAIPCNHGSLTVGNLAGQLELLCSYAGIPVFRCDEEGGLRDLIRSRGAARTRR